MLNLDATWASDFDFWIEDLTLKEMTKVTFEMLEDLGLKAEYKNGGPLRGLATIVVEVEGESYDFQPRVGRVLRTVFRSLRRFPARPSRLPARARLVPRDSRPGRSSGVELVSPRSYQPSFEGGLQRVFDTDCLTARLDASTVVFEFHDEVRRDKLKLEPSDLREVLGHAIDMESYMIATATDLKDWRLDVKMRNRAAHKIEKGWELSYPELKEGAREKLKHDLKYHTKARLRCPALGGWDF